LEKIFFKHSIIREIKSNRGQTAIPGECQNSFKWGPGLRAFCILLIKAQQEIISAKNEDRTPQGVAIYGERGSLAAALDGSMAKSAAWLSDCFGCDQQGNSIVRRILTRTNPERKRPGPVSIGISEKVIREFKISITVNHKLIEELEDFVSVDSRLMNETIRTRPTVSLIPSYTKKPTNKNKQTFNALDFEEIFLSHTIKALHATDVFDSHAVKARYQSITRSTQFRAMSGKLSGLNRSVERETNTCKKFGCPTGDDFKSLWSKDRAPLKILLPGSHFSVVSLLESMVSAEDYPFELDYRFSHANEIVNLLLRGQEPEGVDGCVISVGQLARFLSSPKIPQFEPLMIMPAVDLSILSSSNADRTRPLEEGTVHLLHEGGSSSSIFFNELIKKRNKSNSSSKQRHVEPEYFSKFLDEGSEDRVVAWFPYSVLLPKMTGCQVQSFGGAGLKDNFLLLSRRIMEERKIAQSLSVGIRDSWSKLLVSPTSCRQAVRRILSSKDYSESLCRWVGWDQHEYRAAS